MPRELHDLGRPLPSHALPPCHAESNASVGLSLATRRLAHSIPHRETTFQGRLIQQLFQQLLQPPKTASKALMYGTEVAENTPARPEVLTVPS